MAGKRPAGTGTTRQLPSGRWQCRFRGTDGAMRAAGLTFDSKVDAEAWLRTQARDVALGLWAPPEEQQRAGALREYANLWLAGRTLKPATAALYRSLLDDLILPHLGHLPLDRITPEQVRRWHAELRPTPTRQAHAYSLLRSIYRTAVADDRVEKSPCRIVGAGRAKTVHKTETATVPELRAIVAAIAPRYRAMVLLAAWCGLRFGELAELRLGDLDLEDGRVHVRRGVTRANGRVYIGDPKSEAGRRTVSIPPHILGDLADHIGRYVEPEDGALLFPARQGGHMAPASLYRVWYPAREAAGRPDLRFHDLRHTGATMAAATGATLAELQSRLGHSTVAAAMRYQHAAADRDRVIAERLSALALT